jgi:hypothetical protein
MAATFALFLFSTSEAYVPAVEAGAIDGVVVDWETADKHERQVDRDLQIGTDTQADLARIRAATRGRVLCRVNGPGAETAAEVERAIEGGADEVLVPMVRNVEEVETVLEAASGRCDVGILVETEAAVASSRELSRLPLARAYVGLNDLAIDRGSDSIFDPLVDGTLERLRATFDCPFGFGGLTVPASGAPIPSRLLIAETARLRCDFGVLRRSFLADVPPERAAAAAEEIRSAYVSRGQPDNWQEELERRVVAIGRAAEPALLRDAAAGA